MNKTMNETPNQPEQSRVCPNCELSFELGPENDLNCPKCGIESHPETQSETPDRQEVVLVGPTVYRVDLTDEELEAVKDSDFPIGEIPEPKEWEPVGTAEEWSIHTEDDTDT